MLTQATARTLFSTVSSLSDIALSLILGVALVDYTVHGLNDSVVSGVRGKVRMLEWWKRFHVFRGGESYPLSRRRAVRWRTTLVNAQGIGCVRCGRVACRGRTAGGFLFLSG